MFMKVLIFILLCLPAYNSQAAIVNWTIDAEAGRFLAPAPTETFIGSFTFDTDAGLIYEVDLTVTEIATGDTLFNYQFARRRLGGNQIVDFFELDPFAASTDLTQESILSIGFNLTEPLDYSNSIGSFPITSFFTDPNHVAQSSRSTCLNSVCVAISGTQAIATSGTLTGSPVPLPASIWFMGLGLIYLYRFRKCS